MMSQQKNFDLQGHRGCRGLMPENTIPAMLHALDLGVQTLEMDVVVSKDGIVIVSHDPFMNSDISLDPQGKPITHTEERQFVIYQMTYEEIARWDVGLKPHPKYPDQKKTAAQKPKLEDLIDAVERYASKNNLTAPFYNIETKSRPAGDGRLHPGPEVFTELLMQVIQKKGISSRTTIQSFDSRTLKIIHANHPGIKTSYLIEASDKSGMIARLNELGFTPNTYSPAFQLVTKDLVDACHARGMKILPWTVNDASEMLRLYQLGVDGIISDYPDRFFALRKTLEVRF